mgnify:CR=1 FL=1
MGISFCYEWQILSQEKYLIKMSQADAIIKSLRDGWIKLKDSKESLRVKYENIKPSDDNSEDVREEYEGSKNIYNAHLQNIATNIKNNFYSLEDVERIDSELASELEEFLED